eukprot:9481504-Pyramimonas_sp.AAC.1
MNWGSRKPLSTLEPDNLDDHMKVSTRWHIRRLTNRQCEPRPKCVVDFSSGAASGRSGCGESDRDTIADLLGTVVGGRSQGRS